MLPRVFSPQTKKMMYLVLEYCDGGDLDAFLHKHGRLPEAVAKDLMRQLGTALIGIYYLFLRKKVIWICF